MKPLTVSVNVVSLLLYIGQTLGNEPWPGLQNITGGKCPETCFWPKNIATGPYCCKECSCDEDCTLNNNCCFEELYQNDQRLQLQQRCTIAATRNLDKHAAFEMIDKNPKTGCINSVEGMAKKTQCGDVAVAEWGSIYPVISRNTGQIYRNEICALCHNDTNYAPWTPVQICKKKGRGTHFFANMLNFISISKYFSDQCYFVFQVDGFDDVLYNRQCFKSYINHCRNPSSFTIPAELNLTRTEVVNACVSGFMSSVENYANIFCWMCDNRSNKLPYCNLDPGYRFFSGFSLLLDPVKLAVLKEENKVIHTERQACLKTEHALKDKCVRLFCPTGQIWMAERCDFVTQQWRQANFYIQMKLKVLEEQAQDNSSIAKILDYFYRNNISTIESSMQFPWGKGWRIKSIFFKSLFESDTNSGYIVFELQWVINMFEPNKVLKERNTSLIKGNVELDIGQQRFRFSSEIDNIPIFQKTYPDQIDKRSSFNIVKETKRTTAWLMPLYITKLYFCEQVELHSDEFILAPAEDLLYYNGTQNYLYWNEFTVFQVNGNTAARICISDSSYSTDPSSEAIRFPCDFMLTVISVTVLFV